MNGPDPRIRPATPDDVPQLVALVRGLAGYERVEHEALMTEAQLTDALFGPNPALHAHVGLDRPVGEGGQVVGLAVWFLNFSTWRGTHGIYLEDLFVLPEHRGSGLGAALLRTLAQVCVERGYQRLEWSVLDWNTPAIDFYKAAGALPMDEWTVFRLTDDALEKFAGH